MATSVKPQWGGAADEALTGEERRLLLGIARQAIAAALEGHAPQPPQPSRRLAELRGAFTTLHLEGQLRGCVGYPLAVRPLYLTVAETAVAAAFNDPRFLPLTREEFPQVQIELSVLSPLKKINPAQVEVGRHGLLLTVGASRGLLLPQVAVEFGWDAETFVRQTCVKAGLPPDAYREAGALLQAFTAEVFGEELL